MHFPLWLSRLISPMPTDGIFDAFDQKIDRLLTERGRTPDAEPKDLLARLIAARDSETGGGMTAKEVRDQVVTIFMAGHETTSQALSWTWYLLSLHPAVETKLHAELADVLGGRTPRYDDIANLRYTRMVIEEIDAALSAGAHHRAASRSPPTRSWITASRPAPRSSSCRGSCIASRSCGRIRSASIRNASRRTLGRAAALCLYSVRRGAAHLHRRRLRDDGSDPDPRHHRAALPLAS